MTIVKKNSLIKIVLGLLFIVSLAVCLVFAGGTTIAKANEATVTEGGNDFYVYGASVRAQSEDSGNVAAIRFHILVSDDFYAAHNIGTEDQDLDFKVKFISAAKLGSGESVLDSEKATTESLAKRWRKSELVNGYKESIVYFYGIPKAYLDKDIAVAAVATYTTTDTENEHYGETIVTTQKAGSLSWVAWSADRQTGSTTYASYYSEKTRNIVWKDEDGTELKSEDVTYGSMPAYGTAPVKTADETYTYAFNGWDKEVVYAVDDATYTATYSKTYKNYTVTFKDYDETLIDQKTYHYGDNLEVPSDPTRASDNYFNYAFNGWDNTVITSVTGNATYIATYSSSDRFYTVTFNNTDESQYNTASYRYNETVTDPTGSAAQHALWTHNSDKYDFSSPVTGDITLTASEWYTGIATIDEFELLNGSSGNFILENDIDFSGQTYSAHVITSFAGVLDGNGYSLKNITFNPVNVPGYGIFGTLSGTVRNIGFENITLNNYGGMQGNSGIIANTCSGATITDVLLTGSMIGTNAVVLPWADYTTWGFKSGLLFCDGTASVGDIFIDVEYTNGTDIKITSGKGTTTITGNVYIVDYGTADLGNWAQSATTGWIGKNTVVNLVTEARSRLNGNVWDCSGDDKVPTLKHGSSIVVSAPTLYTVTFNSNGGSSVPAKSIGAGRTATASTTTKTGYTFSSWQFNGVDYDFSTPIQGNITLDAVWNPNYYNVSFKDTDGTTDLYSSQSIAYGSTATNPDNANNKHKVWKLNGVKYDFSTPITQDTTLVYSGYYGISNVAEFYAINDSSDRFILENDIDFSGKTYSPINVFNGYLEGNGYAIKNVTMTATKEPIGSATAIFRNCAGTLKDISFLNIVLNAAEDGDCGGTGLIASRFTGTVERVYLQGTMHGTCKTTSPTSVGIEHQGTWAGACFGYTSGSANITTLMVNVALDSGSNIFGVSGLAKNTPALNLIAISTGYWTNWAGGGFVRQDGGWHGRNTMDLIIDVINNLYGKSPAWNVDTTNYTITGAKGYLI